MGMKFTNNAATTLASGINASVTSLSVATGTGALFPTLSGGDYFYCTLANSAGTVEIVKVTARSTDTFTIVRGQDNTTAASWVTGDRVELRLVAATLNDLPKLDEANTFTQAPTFSTALAVTSGGTGTTTSTGSGSVVLSTSPTFTTPLLGTPTSGVLTNCTGYTYANLSGTVPTWNQNTTGTAAGLSATLAVASGGTGVTTSTGTGSVVLSNSPTLVTPALGTPASGNFSTGTFTWPTFNQNTSGTAAGLSATLTVASGGTGSTTLAANNVLLGNGTSALQAVAPGTSGNVLTSNGTTWTSAPPSGGGGGITTGKAIAMAIIFGG